MFESSLLIESNDSMTDHPKVDYIEYDALVGNHIPHSYPTGLRPPAVCGVITSLVHDILHIVCLGVV